MNKTGALLSFLFLFLTAGFPASLAVNPLTFTDIPDNDVIRVEEDYYMVSTTMYFCPGAPIMHSRDLVHWEIVSYIYDFLEDDDVYNLRNGKNAYGKGQWATSLRFHDGVFYALFVANDQHRTYLYRTRDIVNGPWERFVLDGFFHDASLLFDEGHLYLVYGNGDLRLRELEPDGSAVKADVPEQVIIRAPSEGYGLRAEGSHFYHIGPYYYVLEIDWPKDGIRTATMWRSSSLTGPYESRTVLQGTLGGRDDGVAQGPIIDTPGGDWYAIQFQDHGAVGRIPTIQRVTWTDGWPIMGQDGVPEEEVEVNLPAWGRDYVWDSDEFDTPRLALVWQWNHKAPENWSLTARPGWLRLGPQGASKRISDARGTLTQRTVGPRCVSETLLDVSGMKPGDEAGLCAFQSRSARIGVEVTRTGKRRIVFKIQERTCWKAVFKGDRIFLRIRYVFTPQEDDTCGPDTAFLSFSTDGENWTEMKRPLKMTYTLDYFTGYRSALYCRSCKGNGGFADFDWFHQYTY